MKRHGATKEEIIKLISHGDNTLSAISEKLNLAPSTVSRHLHDLEANGTISQRNTRFKRWKYYDLNPKSNADKVRKSGITISKIMAVSTIALVLLIGAYVVMGYYGRAQPGTSYIPISITDPPQVPQGTQALYINYSSLSVHVDSGSGYNWINLNSSGRLDLMSLINESQVIGLANIEPNSTVNEVRFNITSASITIDNITYGVYVPTKQVTAKVGDGLTVNYSSDVLIDFSPAIAVMNIDNTTIFALVPSLKAAVIPDSSFGMQPNFASQQTVAFRGLNGPNPFQSTAIDVAASNASLHLNGSSIAFNVTLENNGSDNISIVSMFIEGQSTHMISGFWLGGGPGPITFPGVNATATVTSQQVYNDSTPANSNFYIMHYVGEGNPNAINATSNLYKQINSTLVINASALYTLLSDSSAASLDINSSKPIYRIIISNFSQISPLLGQASTFAMSGPGGLNFIVNSNGTLSLPTNLTLQQPSGALGYTLTPHAAEIFSYNGSSGIEAANLPQNSTYTLVIFTNMGPVQTNFSIEK